MIKLFKTIAFFDPPEGESLNDLGSRISLTSLGEKQGEMWDGPRIFIFCTWLYLFYSHEEGLSPSCVWVKEQSLEGKTLQEISQSGILKNWARVSYDYWAYCQKKMKRKEFCVSSLFSYDLFMKTLFILCGWPGNEHEVSLRSGKNLSIAARSKDIPTELVQISKNMEWVFESNPLISFNSHDALNIVQKNGGGVFPVIHGEYGEDGQLQFLLEQAGIPFVGSSSQTMKLTLDKSSSSALFREHGLSVPQEILVRNLEDIAWFDTFPCIVKPVDEGSSISVYKIASKKELEPCIQEELRLRNSVLVQKFIQGREFTCGVIEIDGELLALEPTEIILTQGTLFDYAAKYTPGGCLEITPADIPAELRKEIQETAKKTHRISKCSDLSRTDMIYQSDGTLVVLEINTLPGMTETSFIPAQLKAAWFSLEEFIEKIARKILL